jgi:hypothetical protein
VSALSAVGPDGSPDADGAGAAASNSPPQDGSDDDDGSILLEPCPVRRTVNFCVAQMHNGSAAAPSSYFRSFFGGLPAFEKGCYVENAPPKDAVAAWPPPPATASRRFLRDHPAFVPEFEDAAAPPQPPKAAADSDAHKDGAGDAAGAPASVPATSDAAVVPVATAHQRKPNRLREVVIVSLLDCLTEYDIRKKAESFAKRFFLLKDMSEVSCSPAEFYASRFLTFVARDVLVPAQEVD